MPSPADRIADIRKRAAAATPGPWERLDDQDGYPPNTVGYLRGEHLRGVGSMDFGFGEEADADEAFVLAARQDVDWLLAEVERLTADLAAFRLGQSTGHLYRVGDDGAVSGELFAGELDELKRFARAARIALTLGSVDHLRNAFHAHERAERDGLRAQQLHDGHQPDKGPNCDCPWCYDDERPTDSEAC